MLFGRSAQVTSPNLQIAHPDVGFATGVTSDFQLKNAVSNLHIDVKSSDMDASEGEFALIDRASGRPVPLSSEGHEQGSFGWSREFSTGRLNAGDYTLRLEPEGG